MAETAPILFVPGLNCTAALFGAQILRLCRTHPCVVADHGVVEDLSEVATAVLAQAPARFALCGLSMGGYVAFEIMRCAPERVTRLALLDTSAGLDRPETTATRLANIALAQSGRFDEVVDKFWPRFVHPARREDRALRAVYERMATDTGADRFVRQMRTIMSRPDSQMGLSRIGVPTLVLVGEQDLATPVGEAKSMADAIPKADLAVIPHCGHLSTLEMPETVANRLPAWAEA
jgi:pimeloyl-ACP methyl ester carboxylesterase